MDDKEIARLYELRDEAEKRGGKDILTKEKLEEHIEAFRKMSTEMTEQLENMISLGKQLKEKKRTPEQEEEEKKKADEEFEKTKAALNAEMDQASARGGGHSFSFNSEDAAAESNN